ncbi:MAG: hypothetical protein V1766_15710 [Pseudomonadota bacterium]
MEKLHRGSRKHVLDWTGHETFLTEFEQFLAPCTVSFPYKDAFMPKGINSPLEARLERFGPSWLPEKKPAWDALKDWWLCHKAGANTPNWDIAAVCEIEGQSGLVLVEAKANRWELGKAGKPIAVNASTNSRQNHERIAAAIKEACAGWQHIDNRVLITHKSRYQLANRLAFAWKLASLGIPVVLVYLGFTGDEGIRGSFMDDAAWQDAFDKYTFGNVPLGLFGKRLKVESTPIWLLSRCRQVTEMSPAVSKI